MKKIIDINKLEMREVHLTCPVKSEDLIPLQLGDQVYLSGVIYTGRESFYQHLIDQGLELPVPISEISNVNFHCSPAASASEDGHVIKAVTATASFRFGKWMEEFFKKTACKIIIGKAGMTSADYKKHFVPAGAIYLTTVGYGLGATYGRAIRKVQNAYWLEELGVAQAVWVLEVEKMGPFIVESDSEGKSLFEQCNEKINENLKSLYEKFPQPVLRRFGEEVEREHEVI
jgi:L(+)-tartrate dehydratase beta subunit